MMDRNEAAAVIRRALRLRSGQAWSVTVGRGTVWGWITICAPESRLDGSTMAAQDCAHLGRLLGRDGPVHEQGESVPPEDRDDVVERARGLDSIRECPRCGKHAHLTACADDLFRCNACADVVA